MGFQKNVAGQKWRVFAFDRTDNTPKTANAAQITAKIAIDDGTRTAITDTNPTETEDGFYLFDLTQAETNGDKLSIYPESATADIQLVGSPSDVFTVPANFAALGIASDGDISGNLDGTVATLTTYTGNTPQTADHTAGIADVPTVAEFNARTLAAAAYFDPAADTVATVTDVTTKTGYSLSTAGILAIWHQLVSAVVTASTMGKLLVDNINETISSRNATTPLTAAQVNAEVDTALADYDGPTKAEMDTAHALLATPAEVATELATYDGPTRTEATADKDAIITQGDAAWVTGAGGTANDVYEIKGSYMLTSTTLNYVYWLEKNGQRVGTISAPSIDIFDKDAATISFVSTPTIVGTNMAKGSGTFSPTDNVPYTVVAKATYATVEYTGVLPAGATAA